MKIEYIPENNLVALFLLTILTCGLYYFWWIARVSRHFDDNPVSNIILMPFTAFIWAAYLNLKYMQRSEELNGRQMSWFYIIFLPTLVIPILIIQHNINERYFPGR